MNRFKMFSSQNHDTETYPDVPSSLKSDSVELPNIRMIQEARANAAPYLTPYLGLRSRLSQIWINRWTVLLLLVLVRVVLLIAQLNDNVGDAKSKALSACSKVEDVGSAMASMPHYLSRGVNEMAATGIEKAVSAMVVMLDLILQGVEGIIFFFINFLVGTYVCLLTALVKGSLDAVASVTEDVGEMLNDVIGSATKEIKDISGDLEEGIQDAIDGIKDLFNPGSEGPTVDFSGPIDKLEDFEINAEDFAKDIRGLNDKIPNFDEVQNMTKEAIAIPFDFVRKALNESYGGYTFDRDVFPLAQKESMTFCSDNDNLNDFFEGLYKLIERSRVIFIVVLSLLAVGVMAPMAWFEIQRWRRHQRHARLIEQNHYDSMDVVYIASRPTTSHVGIKLSSRFAGKRQILTRWCIAYATSPPAIFVLSLALAGFFSCLCQYIILKAVQNEVPAIAGQVGAFADDVVDNLSGVSEKWASDANGVIINLNDDINKDVLGYVKNATDSVNDTITTFTDTMNDGLETVFGDTILEGPIKAVVRCVIGLKIESVQKGLTWVHDHAQISLPLFANDTFSMGAKDSVGEDSELNTFLASPSTVTTDEVTGAVKKVVDWLHDNIVVEALISTGILLVYVIVVLLGVTRALAGMAAPDKTRAEGGGLRFTGDDEPSRSPPRSPPQAWGGNGQLAPDAHDSYAGNEKSTMRSRYPGGFM
ncbi:Plasma membrane fusion protein-like protein [Hapsidospora chrysogenum ATCC 11550]|uniref:Plasma membrane fusion protein PRM1 n=1 Tax=Hapsidospora chrysogenum (strain ATCC 11550 / CBS 779.69 / DSM 880 / IAM 14645 / JCM 23072 / IMI 49137) TaxID=857340 RepID=A0A086T4R3_HAPC1|nr:Plasma membrane fusion protein-like protein [Hapsidospora chrysogenum ATCC 11550]